MNSLRINQAGTTRQHTGKFLMVSFEILLVALTIAALMFLNRTPERPNPAGQGHSNLAPLDLFP